MTVSITPIDRPEVPPLSVSNRFRHEVAYFAWARDDERIPEKLGESEYWFDPDTIQTIYDEGVVRLVSPLDSDSVAELEITEEQERILEWFLEHGVRHAKLV